jgi:hypothetical protein
VRAPDRQQVAHRAAADIQDVLLAEQLVKWLAQLAQPEQRQVLGDARAPGEARFEGVDLGSRVAGGGSQEQDPRFASTG